MLENKNSRSQFCNHINKKMETSMGRHSYVLLVLVVIIQSAWADQDCVSERVFPIYKRCSFSLPLYVFSDDGFLIEKPSDTNKRFSVAPTYLPDSVISMGPRLMIDDYVLRTEYPPAHVTGDRGIYLRCMGMFKVTKSQLVFIDSIDGEFAYDFESDEACEEAYHKIRARKSVNFQFSSESYMIQKVDDIGYTSVLDPNSFHGRSASIQDILLIKQKIKDLKFD